MDRRPLQDDSEDMRSVPRLVSGIQSLSSIREGEARRCIPISSWQRKPGETRELGGGSQRGGTNVLAEMSSWFSFSGSCIFHVGPLTVSAHCAVFFSFYLLGSFQELGPCSSCGGHNGLVGTVRLESMHDRVKAGSTARCVLIFLSRPHAKTEISNIPIVPNGRNRRDTGNTTSTKSLVAWHITSFKRTRTQERSGSRIT